MPPSATRRLPRRPRWKQWSRVLGCPRSLPRDVNPDPKDQGLALTRLSGRTSRVSAASTTTSLSTGSAPLQAHSSRQPVDESLLTPGCLLILEHAQAAELLGIEGAKNASSYDAFQDACEGWRAPKGHRPFRSMATWSPPPSGRFRSLRTLL